MIVYLGNMLSAHTGGVSVIESLTPRLAERFNIKAFSTNSSKLLRLLDMWFALFKYRKQTSIVLIDSYSSPLAFSYALSSSILCQWLSIKYIPILHGGDFPQRLQKWPLLCSVLFKNSYHIISPSEYLKQALRKYGYHCQVIPNAIDISEYVFTKRSKIKPRLLWVRSFSQTIYNPILAIKVFHLFQQKFPDALLCMVGPDKDGSLEQCRSLAQELNIYDKIEFTGSLSRKAWKEKSLNYDIFINTTNVDNTPLSLIEAMALGMPVVTTNVGGIPFMVKDRFNALLVPPNDVDAFAASLFQLMTSPNLVQELSVNGRNTSLKWSWNEIIPKWIELITPLI